jgi:hypothetical protein
MRIQLPVTRIHLLATAAGLGLLFTTTSVHAEPVRPGLDSFTMACAALQNNANALAKEYKDASDDRRGDIIRELRNIGLTWRQIGCQAVFGSIALLPSGTETHSVGTVVVTGALKDSSGTASVTSVGTTTGRPIVKP